jgi:transcriptional regulator with XRE-family HTH domain
MWLDELALIKQTWLSVQQYAHELGDVNTSFRRANMTTENRRRPAVGVQVRRWRTDRGMTLAKVAEKTGLNIGYLSQIENDKASPSLGCLASIGEALDVPIAWFLIDDVPPPTVVRAVERPVTMTEHGRTEHVDGRRSRDVQIIEVTSGGVGGRIGAHSHTGDEHHIVLRGRFRLWQGDHVVEVGPGDYVRWDGTIPHDGEVVEVDADGTAAMLLIRIHPKD